MLPMILGTALTLGVPVSSPSPKHCSDDPGSLCLNLADSPSPRHFTLRSRGAEGHPGDPRLHPAGRGHTGPPGHPRAASGLHSEHPADLQKGECTPHMPGSSTFGTPWDPHLCFPSPCSLTSTPCPMLPEPACFAGGGLQPGQRLIPAAQRFHCGACQRLRGAWPDQDHQYFLGAAPQL